MTNVRHLYATIGGQQIFYREAGAIGAPPLLLLHGFPASSFMFRHLIPQLEDRYRVVAPDLLGFGFSGSPPVNEFDYTFGALAELTSGLLRHLEIDQYAMYVHDYGAPVGWRLALQDPDSILAIVSQNGNGYEAGFEQAFWKPVRQYWDDQNAHTEAALREALSLEAIKWQYVHGVPEPSTVSPDTWTHDHSLISRSGNDLVQLRLFADYVNNLTLYPHLHAFLRESQVPILAVWGKNDQIFGPAGARAFADDSPAAEIRLLDGGHFLLESHLDSAVAYIREFLERAIR
jgi:pimeloyl-ACP methyl ester carboxylesterase